MPEAGSEYRVDSMNLHSVIVVQKDSIYTLRS